MSTVKVDTIEPRTASSTITIGAAANNLTTLTSAASITMDLNNNNNFKVTLAHNATFNNPSNPTAGQTGSIFITQDGTGSRTASWGTSWDFIGGTAPTILRLRRLLTALTTSCLTPPTYRQSLL